MKKEQTIKHRVIQKNGILCENDVRNSILYIGTIKQYYKL